MNSNRTERGFSKVSRVYDALAAILFGKTIKRSQRALLSVIKPCSHVLVLGGGTGWILESIFKVCPGVYIDYVDLSAGMIKRSKARLANSESQRKVNFIQGTYELLPKEYKYDVILTPFFLDMFTTNSACQMINNLQNRLKVDGAWLYTDFKVTNNWWQSTLLWLMYRFFRICCAIEAGQLPEVKPCFINHGMLALQTHTFYHGMIESIYYQKKEI